MLRPAQEEILRRARLVKPPFAHGMTLEAPLASPEGDPCTVDWLCKMVAQLAPAAAASEVRDFRVNLCWMHDEIVQRPSSARNHPKVHRFWLDFGRIQPKWSKPSRTWPKCGHSWPDSGHIGAIGQRWPLDFGQSGLDSGRCCPEYALGTHAAALWPHVGVWALNACVDSGALSVLSALVTEAAPGLIGGISPNGAEGGQELRWSSAASRSSCARYAAGGRARAHAGGAAHARAHTRGAQALAGKRAGGRAPAGARAGGVRSRRMRRARARAALSAGARVWCAWGARGAAGRRAHARQSDAGGWRFPSPCSIKTPWAPTTQICPISR